MARGGKRAHAGRPKGSLNATTKERQELIAASVRRHAKKKDAIDWIVGEMVKAAPTDPAARRWLADWLCGRAPIAIEGGSGGPILVEIIRKEMNDGGGQNAGHQRDGADVPPRPKSPARHRAR